MPTNIGETLTQEATTSAAQDALFSEEDFLEFSPFDPLEFKTTQASDAAFGALKREISNILSSYVGWYDPFCELIQNALDAVEARMALEKDTGTDQGYQPAVRVIVDIDSNSLTVTDNGIGLDQEKFQQFLAPNFSFKTESGNTRGHKGVGATYVAYGFNYMRVSTRTPGFQASGRIRSARTWLTKSGSGGNPRVEPDASKYNDPSFAEVDRGVSITVRFDDDTHPKKLDWLGAQDAKTWAKILAVKTGLGSVVEDEALNVTIEVIRKGETTTHTSQGTKYLWLHDSAPKTARLRDINKTADDLYKKHGAVRKLPDKFRNLDFIYESWTSSEISELVASSLDEDDLDVITKFAPTVSMEYGYTAKLWNQFNASLNVRSGYKVLTSGIQLAANNMPQGETVQVPLTSNIGRQNQVHFLFHFENYTPDLGRKGFHRELTDFAKVVAASITQNHVSKRRDSLKANTGVSPDLMREMKIDEWKKEMLAHEVKDPLSLSSEHFFRPTERVSITSVPTREQDVIALFHQLIAGGVIRGMRIMSTNERFTYDGLFKIVFDLAPEIYVYDPVTNPLGVPKETAEFFAGKTLAPNILEYKYSLDGLIEDFDNQDKNINDINLAIAWDTGSAYKERYGITSLLIPENADQRQYHGVTHTLYDIETGNKHCELVILSELIDYLNDPEKTAELQRAKYE
ncbi:hypothetical protein ACFVTM_17130 [Arthrobacter sp. NPDC058130]|uniref:hypothetical protein n=1 Tax=Arthrobacter sp. NPDC058130 TaxID=3346353 RepID=UPI0036E63864